MAILVTGCAGFIGAALSEALLAHHQSLIGIDNLNNYYDVNLKKARLQRLQSHANFNFHQIDIIDKKAVIALFQQHDIQIIVNMAAQAGVRYSLDNPQAYIDSNIVGFMNLLEAARQFHIEHFVFASSSSVYGANKKQPFSERDPVDHPISLYAATKKSNELMAHSYAHLFQIPCTGIRFFTVYGPWGRPDMAPFKFTKAILSGETIQVYNHGEMSRDFTYIDDIVTAVLKIIDKPARSQSTFKDGANTPDASFAPYRIYNIGHHDPIPLMSFIQTIEQATGKEAIIDFQPMQAGDVPSTYADVTALVKDFNYQPQTSLKNGIKQLVNWYQHFYDK